MDYTVIDHKPEQLQNRATALGLGRLSPACFAFQSETTVRIQTAGVPQLQALVDHLVELGKAKLAT
jgi:hypothetical protein